METDFTQPLLATGLIVYPDFVFATQPREDPLIELDVIQGQTGGTNISITGTVGTEV